MKEKFSYSLCEVNFISFFFENCYVYSIWKCPAKHWKCRGNYFLNYMKQAKPSRRDEDWPRSWKVTRRNPLETGELCGEKKVYPEYCYVKKKKSQRKIYYGPPCIKANLIYACKCVEKGLEGWGLLGSIKGKLTFWCSVFCFVWIFIGNTYYFYTHRTYSL